MALKANTMLIQSSYIAILYIQPSHSTMIKLIVTKETDCVQQTLEHTRTTHNEYEGYLAVKQTEETQ